jgi:hypothetical protein
MSQKIQRQSWCKPFPQQFERFTLDFSVNESEFEKLKSGHEPDENEDKWYVFYENNILHFHRAQTGDAIFQVRFSSENNVYHVVEVRVSRDVESYKSTNAKLDAETVYKLMCFLIGRKYEMSQMAPGFRSLGDLRHTINKHRNTHSFLGLLPNQGVADEVESLSFVDTTKQASLFRVLLMVLYIFVWGASSVYFVFQVLSNLSTGVNQQSTMFSAFGVVSVIFISLMLFLSMRTYFIATFPEKISGALALLIPYLIGFVAIVIGNTTQSVHSSFGFLYASAILMGSLLGFFTGMCALLGKRLFQEQKIGCAGRAVVSWSRFVYSVIVLIAVAFVLSSAWNTLFSPQNKYVFISFVLFVYFAWKEYSVKKSQMDALIKMDKR